MAKEIKITDKELNIKVPYYIYPIIIILSFIASFSWGSIHNLENNASALLGIKNNIVKYETYTVSIPTLASQNEENRKDAEDIKNILENVGFNSVKRFEFVEDNADITIQYTLKSLNYSLYKSYIVPVGHVYWIDEDTTREEMLSNGVYIETGGDEYIQTVLSYLTEEINSVDDLSDILEDSEGSVGFVDINDLSKEYKVLKLDGEYFFDNPDKGGLPYSLGISEDSPEFLKSVISQQVQEIFLDRSFDIEKLSKVNMTGVTAIVRSLAAKVDASGNDAYPAELIGEFLADADLTHVSNEISFMFGCRPSDGMKFCSDPGYIKALEASGVDIVELTGNHNNDYGSSANTDTIEAYMEKGWDYFGGGLDADDAAKILYKEVNGSTIAFLGYNYYDTMLGTGAIATDSHAGANSYSSKKLKDNIEEAKENSDVVIVDFQFQECYSYPADGGIYPICYKPLTVPDQRGVFKEAVEFGADIVIGTQAHQPQTYELYEDGIIFYGLGNLYFDQTPWIGTMHGMVLSHYFYDGAYLNTQITTTNYDYDMQTYVSEGEERKLLLELLKDARD